MISDIANPGHVREQSTVWLNEFTKSMFGLENVAKLCLVALVTDGHVLLEGNPGLGKTELVKTLTRIIRLTDGRIQFTPDLMPSDITGTLHPSQEGSPLRLQFKEGPILSCNLLLADEINRATPKTQAAMLEAMAERHVTVLGDRHSTKKPFMVLATQNPLEHEGTYPLPEAQLDRFMFKIHMPFPAEETMRSILEKPHRSKASQQSMSDPDASAKVDHIGKAVDNVKVLPHLIQYIVRLVTMLGGNSGVDQLEQVRDFVRIGPGPRAAISLLNGAKAWRLLFAEDASEIACEQDLAKVALPVLRHRVHLRYDWRERADRKLALPEALSDIEARDAVLLSLCRAVAPREDNSWENFVDGLPKDQQRFFKSYERR